MCKFITYLSPIRGNCSADNLMDAINEKGAIDDMQPCDPCHALLLRPMPLMTFHYLMEEGVASLKDLTRTVFQGKSNLLQYIIEHSIQWLLALDDDEEKLRSIIE